MAVALVQSAKAHTTTNNPASITPTFSGGTTAGNLLVLACGNGFSSAPAGWVEVGNDYGVLAVFYYPNNPGSITSVATTLTGITTGAFAIVAEFSGVSGTIEAFGNTRANGYNVIVNNPVTLGELNLVAIYDDGNTSLVLSPSGDWTQIQTDTSTGATTNVTGWMYYLLSSTIVTRPSAQVSSGNHPALVYERFPASPAGTPIVYDNVGGGEGIYVPRYYQGSIGG